MTTKACLCAGAVTSDEFEFPEEPLTCSSSLKELSDPSAPALRGPSACSTSR